jgi:hypothetical protein
MDSSTKQKIEAMVAYAKTQPSNIRHFLQLSSYPLRSVSITYDTTHSKGGHLVMNQEAPYEYLIPKPDSYETTGYEWFIRHLVANGVNYPSNKQKWSEEFDRIVEKINDAIHVNHGVLCEREKGVVTYSNHDKVLFHICDIIVMFVHSMTKKLNEETPSFYIKTPSINGLNLNEIDDEFVKALTKKQKEFFLHNADFIFVIYAYWSNCSMLPVRLTVDNKRMPNAFKLSKESRFIDHQEGKLIQLKREQVRVIDNRHFMF